MTYKKMLGRKWRHPFKIKARPLKKEAHLGEIFSYHQLKVVLLFLTIISTNLTCRKNRSDTIKLTQSVHALCMCSSRTFPEKDLLITRVVFSNEKHICFYFSRQTIAALMFSDAIFPFFDEIPAGSDQTHQNTSPKIGAVRRSSYCLLPDQSDC